MKMTKVYISFVLICFCFTCFSIRTLGQENRSVIQGEVSYISGANIYVKFESTAGIEKGDTLYVKEDESLIPALIVQHKSSISCLGNTIGKIELAISDVIFAKVQLKVEKIEQKIDHLLDGETDVSEHVLKTETESIKTSFKQNINGRVSLSAYSNFSEGSKNNSTRMRYTFSLDAKNISNSRFSVQSYISFVHKTGEWDQVKENIFNALKIYSLAVQYDFNKHTNLWIGRKINPRIANVGAIDGLQFQTSFNNFYAGAVAGTRPDYTDYSFNSSLFEYGAFVGHNKKLENGFVQSSLAFFEQRNKSNIDRRFLYLQHSNMIAKNLNLFSSSEIDLYKVEDGLPSNSLSLTSLYLSLRYRVSRGLSLFGSYDTRKNVIYYETFKNYADQVLQQAVRQGLRFRINLRPAKFLNVSVNAGTRFSDADTRKTKTLNLSTTYTQVPVLKASVTLTANLMQTNYLDGSIYGIRISKDLVPGKIYTILQYRYVNFEYLSSINSLKEHITEFDFSFQIDKKIFLSLNLEAAFQESNNSGRVYINLRKKF